MTAYFEEHNITYLRLLEANAEGAGWREDARLELRLDPEHEPDRAGGLSTAIYRALNG